MKVIVLRHRRVSQVSLGAEGGSNALSTGNGRALQNFGDFVDTKCTGFRGGVELVGAKRVRRLKIRDFTPARHAR